MEADLRQLLTQTVTLEPWTGYDGYSQPVYGVGVARKCRIVNKTRMVRDAQGQERVSTTTIYLDDDYNTSVRDRVTLPGGVQPILLTVERYPDESGAHHERLMT